MAIWCEMKREIEKNSLLYYCCACDAVVTKTIRIYYYFLFDQFFYLLKNLNSRNANRKESSPGHSHPFSLSFCFVVLIDDKPSPHFPSAIANPIFLSFRQFQLKDFWFLTCELLTLFCFYFYILLSGQHSER